MADTALPPLTDDLRCAPQAVELQLDPRGTATPCRALILIEYPGLWPARIEDIDAIAALPPLPPDHRILTTRASDSRAVPGLTVWRAGPDLDFTGVDYELDDTRLAEAVDALAEGGTPDEADGVMEVGPAPPEVLICGHGRRDTCCGNFGVRLLAQAEARAAQAWPGVRVRRCSHTGGHRFAPTGITLPDGRFWSFLDLDVLDAAVTGRPHPRLAEHNRGLASLDPLAQVAEAALFDEIGPTWLRARPHIEPVEREGEGDGGMAAFRITWDDQAAVVTVRRTGAVPVPVCGSPIDEATKSSPTFRVVSIEH
jgi:hypothetical protein